MIVVILIVILGIVRLILFCFISVLSSFIIIFLFFSWDCMFRSFVRYILISVKYSIIFCKRYCTVFVFVVLFEDICDILRTIFIWRKVFFFNFFIFFVIKFRILGINFILVLIDDRVDERIVWCVFFVMVEFFRFVFLIFFFIIFFIGMFKVILLGFGIVTVEVVVFAIDFLSLVLSFILICIFVFNFI